MNERLDVRRVASCDGIKFFSFRPSNSEDETAAPKLLFINKGDMSGLRQDITRMSTDQQIPMPYTSRGPISLRYRDPVCTKIDIHQQKCSLPT